MEILKADIIKRETAPSHGPKARRDYIMLTVRQSAGDPEVRCLLTLYGPHGPAEMHPESYMKFLVKAFEANPAD